MSCLTDKRFSSRFSDYNDKQDKAGKKICNGKQRTQYETQDSIWPFMYVARWYYRLYKGRSTIQRRAGRRGKQHKRYRRIQATDRQCARTNPNGGRCDKKYRKPMRAVVRYRRKTR